MEMVDAPKPRLIAREGYETRRMLCPVVEFNNGLTEVIRPEIFESEVPDGDCIRDQVWWQYGCIACWCSGSITEA